MGILDFYTFIATALIFIMTPGIDSVFVLNKSIGQGRKAGIYSTLGISSGVLVHTLFAALGLSIILSQSATAFSIVKYLGAAYLIFLGLKTVFGRKKTKQNNGENKTLPEHSGNGKNFMSGVLTNTLNPKVALFFLAFFPQFISPESIGESVPFLILGVTYSAIGLLWFTVLTLFSSLFSKKLNGNAKFDKWLNKISGSVFVLMGLKMIFTKK